MVPFVALSDHEANGGEDAMTSVRPILIGFSLILILSFLWQIILGSCPVP
jgi:hypothetical protein